MPRLRAAGSLLLVIDVQDRLVAAVPRGPAVVREVGFLLDVARALRVPALATEQYPKGLGSTAADVARRLETPRPAKTRFSAAAVPAVVEAIALHRPEAVVLAGLEAHVCVALTALDLLERNIHVGIAIDAVASQSDADRDAALSRLDRAGCVLTTAEAVAFEWLEDAAHPQFKTVSRLVQERARERMS